MMTLKLRLLLLSSLHQADNLEASSCHPLYLPVSLGFSQLPASSPTISIPCTLAFYLFSWLNDQNGRLTLDGTVGLDLAIVYVSVQF